MSHGVGDYKYCRRGTQHKSTRSDVLAGPPARAQGWRPRTSPGPPPRRLRQHLSPLPVMNNTNVPFEPPTFAVRACPATLLRSRTPVQERPECSYAA
ncbi:unnamed protein product, partial [Brenthis ino]